MSLQHRLAVAAALAALGGAAVAAGCSAGIEASTTGGTSGGGEDPTTSATGTGGNGFDGGHDVGPDVPPPTDCSDANDCVAFNSQCAQGSCVNGSCTSVPANDFGSCDDGQFCTESDVCIAGTCVGGTEKFCPSLDSCHLGVCDEALKTCKNIAGNDGAQCDDMDPCTIVGSCNGGVCTKGPQVDCSVFDNQCTIGVCDPAVGCKAASANDGSTCDDGQNSPCTVGQCTAGMCGSVPTNEGGPCNDNLFCNVNESCQSGVCAGGVPNPCAPPGGCFIASCNENSDTCTSVPGNNGAACDDFNACTASTTCNNGACINGVPANEGGVCNDGTDCTTGEFCTAGVCGGGVGPAVYFAEDFSDNAQGWVLGPEWQIGFATASMNGVFGADPDTDHTPSGDNGVAGVVIGGNASTNLHAFQFIESPPFNTANAPTVILGFYRWLNSDYDPYMHNVIEIWNGNAWIQIWNSGPPPGVQDSPPEGAGWTFIQHDITQYKNAGMRIRFGMDVTSGGVYTIGSWNIDDVLVAGAACP
jgi:hypothetical protein